MTDNDCFMVGIVFEDGVLLAISMNNGLIYYIDERIYCCASKTGYDRETMLEVAGKVDVMSRANDNCGATVEQTLDLLVKKYEQVDTVEVLLAGEDIHGVHLIALKPCGSSSRVYYAAQGAGAQLANEYLKNEWTMKLNVKQAEQLARRTAEIANNTDKSKLDMCFIFKRTKKQINDQIARNRKKENLNF